jgi:hypothetical protein
MVSKATDGFDPTSYVTPSNVLSGNIMAGASWNSTNTALQQALTDATGMPTQNFAVPGSTTSDTLKQLNDFLGGGGSFAPNSTVFLQAGGVDFLNGVDKGTIKDNLNNIVSTLGDNGVKVVLTGSPYAASVSDVVNNNFNPQVDPIYKDVASANKNVALVDTMGNILQNKSLLRDSLHTNEAGTSQYNADVLAALASMNSSHIGSEKISANAQPEQLLNAAQTSSQNPNMSTAQAISAANQSSQSNNVSTQQIKDLLTNNPNMTDAQIVEVMKSSGISPSQMATATGLPLGEVVSRIAATIPYGNSAMLGDVVVQPLYDVQGSGENEQVGPITGINVTKSTGNVNDKAPVGSQYQTYNPDGTLQNTGTVQNYQGSATKDFLRFALGAAGMAFGLPALGIGEGAALGSLGELGAATGATTGAATIAGTGMTLAELAQLDLALGGAGGTAGALEMAATIGGTGAATAAAEAINGMGGGTGLTQTGNTALAEMGGGTGLLASNAANLEAMGGGQGLLTAGAGGGILGATGLNTGLGVGAGLGTTLAGLNTGVTGGLGGTTGVTGMGGGTGLTAGAAGLGLNAGTAGLGAEGLGAGLTGGALGATNSLLGGAALGSTLGGLGTSVLGSTLGGLAGAGLGGAAGAGLGAAAGGAASGLGSALGTTLGTGLGLSALGSGLGAVANQQGISDARNLINQYGTRASTALSDAYRNAQGLNTANRTDLGNLYQNTSGNLQNLYNQQVGYQNPYQDIGRAGSQGLLANQDYLTRQFNANDLNTNLAPNYAFQLQQGQMANQRAANAGGGALGGNALQGLQRYTQDYAGNAYQQAFNNFNQQRNNIYNSLAGMANIGTTSAGQLAGLGNAYGSNMAGLSNTYGGNLTTNAGQGIGAANAYGLNQANLATGIGSALAGNAVAGGANTANALSTLGNTALLGSLIKPT